MSGNSDFVIENGVLKKYNGPGGDVVIPEGVTRIENQSFYNCTSLTSVTLPESVTSIGHHAFQYCTGLIRITIPDRMTEIENAAFGGCKGLTSIVIPDGVTEIRNFVFSGCEGLTSIVIPDGVTKIGSHAFNRCTGLTSVTIPEGVTQIGTEAFSDCTALRELTLLGRTEIGENAFPDHVSVITAEQLRMSDFQRPADKRAAIKGFALRDSAGAELPEEYRADCLKYIKGQKKRLYPVALDFIPLLHVMLAEKMVSKGDFPGLMEQATANGNAEAAAMLLDYQSKQFQPGELQHQAERDMVREMEAIITGTLTAGDAKKVWKYQKNPDGDICLLDYKGDETEVVVPSAIGKSPVTALGDDAFSPERDRLTTVRADQRRKITAVRLPDTVTKIGNRAFRGCVGLKSMTMDRVTEIGSRAFAGCTGLTSMTIPEGVMKIGDGAFRGCTGLTNVTIPESVTKLESEAFGGCTGLTSIAIPNRVTKIEGWLFWRCENLTRVILPARVSHIGEYAFADCERLTDIVIPEKVTRIGKNAFNGAGLISVTLPEKLTSIGESAFENCWELASITIPASVTKIGPDAFVNCPRLTIHALAGSYAEQYAKEKNIPFQAIEE